MIINMTKTTLTSHEKFMERAVALSALAVEQNMGGPFGCVIVKNNQVVGEGNNRVTADHDPTAHAEIVAIRAACAYLQSFQLDDCIIYTSCEPCPMCFGAIYWSRAKAVYYANTEKQAADAGFDDGLIYREIKGEKQDRKIPFIHLPDEGATQIFEKWKILDTKKYVERMMVILPFEKAFYAKHNYEVDYVGHPLADIVDDFQSRHVPENLLSHLPEENNKIIALLPGSRKQEISVKLPEMLKMAAYFPDYRFVVAKAPGIANEFYDNMLQRYGNVYCVVNKTYELLSVAKAALVTSGTATLETALFHVPQIICYKGNSLSYQLARRLIKIKYIGLVNLILDKPLVKELIQDEFNEENLLKELMLILNDSAVKTSIQNGYKELHTLLHNKQSAAGKAAAIIAGCMKSKLVAK